MQTIESVRRIPRRLWMAIPTALLAAVAPAAAVPAPVSPGSPAGTLIATPCPTFSWAGVPGARSYELLVYRVASGLEEPQEVLRQSLPAATYSWTPPLARCLERGGWYAWSVRSVGGRDEGVWSSPSLFQVAAGPTEGELERALEIVRTHLAGRAEGTTPAGGSSIAASESPTPLEEGRPESLAPAPADADVSRLAGVEVGNSYIRIGGDDVVTTATDSDTLAGLLCIAGQVPKRHTVTGNWFCGSDRLAGMVCSTGQIVRRVGGAWQCDSDRWSGYEVVQGADVTCGPLSSCGGSAQCPAGKVVIAGGVSNVNTEGIQMVSSFPTQATATWHVTLRNTTLTNNRTFTPWAVCAYGSGGY
jgi:hypothetical protein